MQIRCACRKCQPNLWKRLYYDADIEYYSTMKLSADPASQKWPKFVPPLSPEKQVISDDFTRLWHEVSPKKFKIAEDFNHGFPVRYAPKNFLRTLEIGAGLGEHLIYEKLSTQQIKNYVAVEYRQNMVNEIQKRFPLIQSVLGDCQDRLPFPDQSFDRIIAVHVLEHLPNLPECLREMRRLCKPDGVFQVVIPCEGSWAHRLARKISAQRLFEKTYKQSYKWFIEREHINLPHEIFDELAPYFSIEKQTFFPLLVPVVKINLCIGLNLRPR